MIKCEVIEKFSLEAFDKIKNIKRANENRNEKGKLYVGDTFECDEKMCDYLTGNNPINKVVVKVIEVKPKKVEALTDNEEEIKVLEGAFALNEKKVDKVEYSKKTTKKKKNK